MQTYRARERIQISLAMLRRFIDSMLFRNIERRVFLTLLFAIFRVRFCFDLDGHRAIFIITFHSLTRKNNKREQTTFCAFFWSYNSKMYIFYSKLDTLEMVQNWQYMLRANGHGHFRKKNKKCADKSFRNKFMQSTVWE